MRIIKKQKNSNKKNKEENPISLKIDENIKSLKDVFEDCDDVVYRDFRIGIEQNNRMTIVYVDGLVDKELIQEHILKPLMTDARIVLPDPGNVKRKLFELTSEGTLSVADIKEESDLNKGIAAVLSGDTIVLINGVSELLIISTRGWPIRGISEPASEAVIRGPREGFVETFRVNTVLLRRKIKDPKFKIKNTQVGVRSKTDVGIAYIDDIVDFKVLEEVEKRIDAIDIDGILESGYIEQLIEDSWLSIFPQIQSTERPDEVAAALLEGRIAIIVDNTPFVLILPTTLNAFLQSPEDYYERWWASTFIRWVRVVALIISLVLPASYIAIASYHPGIIPSNLAIFIAGSREGVPFPVFIEALLMEGTFELLREAGVRLPSQIGATIGIVGSLIIGQAAVQAGLVNPIMIIIVAVTAISSFSIPSYNFTISFRLLRFFSMIGASVLGLYGLVLTIIVVLVHLSSLKSFGVPYLAPFVSIKTSDFKDSMVRVPTRFMKYRSLYTGKGDIVRMGNIKDKDKGKDEDPNGE